jgi:hypothetical protein
LTGRIDALQNGSLSPAISITGKENQPSICPFLAASISMRPSFLLAHEIALLGISVPPRGLKTGELQPLQLKEIDAMLARFDPPKKGNCVPAKKAVADRDDR